MEEEMLLSLVEDQEMIVHLNLSLYPNPFTDIIKTDDVIDNDVIYVYDALGKVILLKNIATNNTSITVNASQFNEGIYFVNVKRQEKIIQTQRLVKS